MSRRIRQLRKLLPAVGLGRVIEVSGHPIRVHGPPRQAGMPEPALDKVTPR